MRTFRAGRGGVSIESGREEDEDMILGISELIFLCLVALRKAKQHTKRRMRFDVSKMKAECLGSKVVQRSRDVV